MTWRSIGADQHLLRHDLGDQFAITVGRVLAHLGNGGSAVLLPVGGQVLHEVTAEIVTHRSRPCWFCSCDAVPPLACLLSQIDKLATMGLRPCRWFRWR